MQQIGLRIKTFLAFYSTQVVIAFLSLAALWQAIPDEYLFDLYASFPLIAKIKSVVFLVAFIVTFYKARMAPQTLPPVNTPTVVAETAPVPPANP